MLESLHAVTWQEAGIHSGQVTSPSQDTQHSLTPTLTIAASVQSSVHDSDLWEGPGQPEGNPRRHWENMQTLQPLHHRAAAGPGKIHPEHVAQNKATGAKERLDLKFCSLPEPPGGFGLKAESVAVYFADSLCIFPFSPMFLVLVSTLGSTNLLSSTEGRTKSCTFTWVTKLNALLHFSAKPINS